MVRAASVGMFYGVCYDYESDTAKRIESALRKGTTESLYPTLGDTGISIVRYRHQDVTSFGLAIAESVVIGKDWKPLSLHESQRLVQSDWMDRITTYANRHGLTIDAETRFGYWIVPYYG